MTRIGLIALSTIFLACCLTACNSQQHAITAIDNPPAIIIASNYPLFYFAERLTDDSFIIQLPVPSDGDPAFWQPNEQDISTMQQADAVLLNGATYEKWLPTVSLPSSVLVDTSTSFSNEFIQLAVTDSHSHGADGEHSHAGTAFTTWLDMSKAEVQANKVAETLIRLRPENETAIKQNLAELSSELQALDSALKDITTNADDHLVLASHPVYDYLAHRYQLQVSSLMWEPELMPTQQEWEHFEFLKSPGAEWIIYEDEPSADIRAELEKRGVGICVVRPCGNRPAQGDFISVMQANIEALRAIYQP